ncbi:deaminase [Actinomadura logoneensis]|uniref:Deaminase n=1 Tax=Actinomadura logoneensis TaxID=2293572 RepID=A0A372JJL8_9ACTN|nr:dihydrofolate reductase family protein [Actinomadura logoneensis]RFU40211.1 deaminase [Actinomadura logoneensis]
MSERPYVLLSCAASVDGYIDDATDQRLLLSNDEDFDRVDDVRASVDAILVGANTIRQDNPRLLVRSEARRQGRRERGLPESPIKVTFTARGDLDPAAKFFTAGDVEKIVYCASPAVDKCRDTLGGVATVVDAGDPVQVTAILHDLASRGVERLMVEGGGTVHTQFLTAGLADELQLVIAPFFVGDTNAPRFVGPGVFHHHSANRMALAEVRPIGDVILARYLMTTEKSVVA